MQKESFQVCEWRIENFGCWNEELHGTCIYSPDFVFGYAFQMKLLPGDYGKGTQLVVVLMPTSTAPSSGGNLSLIDSDGSLLCTKRTHTEGWGQIIYSGLKFEEVAAKIKKKEDRLILRLCFVSEKSQAVAVSTTLDVLNLSIRIDPNSIKSLESYDSKNISIIRYSKENVLDELLLKAVRKEETIEFVLEVLTKTVRAISVETHWSLQTTDKTVVRNEDNKYIFRNCEPWKFSNSLMSELVQNGISMLLSLKIINGDQIMKTNDPQEISTFLKETVCFFDQSFIMSNDSTSSKKTVDSVTALTKDLMCLYQDQDLSDMQLKCDNVTFPVHKVILSARSPVFKTMFLTDMKEVASGTVDIGDLDPSTLSRFLTYLYTGVLEEELQSERALNLYYAADKYQVPSLKSECADFLCSNVSIDNVCDILSLADKHKDDKLTAVSYNFVVNNFSEVLESEEWAGFMDSEPKLALKTVTEIGRKKHVGKIQKPF